jgi:hypothetical protein
MSSTSSFPMNTRQLRIVQIACILLALSCVVLTVRKPTNHGEATPVHWLITVAAIYCAVSGFTVQRKIVTGPARTQLKRGSTPLSRWRAGHLIRLATAAAVSLWGAVLSIYGGPSWLVYSLLALGLLLLVVWSPGTNPVLTQPEPQEHGS